MRAAGAACAHSLLLLLLPLPLLPLPAQQRPFVIAGRGAWTC
jgi:hypothetical protein